MLSQFAIIPGSFDPALASSPNALDLGIGCLNDLCRGEGLFLDLRAGKWSAALEDVPTKAKVFLRFARQRHRIIPAPPQLEAEPWDDASWLWEAQAYHHKKGCCRAIVVTNGLADEYGGDGVVTALEKLNQRDWWAERSGSVTVKRLTQEYREKLALVLKHANLLMFIDSYVDPCAENFREFPELLLAAGSPGRRPLIEIHRPSWRNVGGRREGQAFAKWIADFDGWSTRLAQAGVKADVYIWEDTHDRYLISDIVSVSVPYGFDVGGADDPPTTWTRLGVKEVERLQREYDRGCGTHGLIGSFEIGRAREE